MSISLWKSLDYVSNNDVIILFSEEFSIHTVYENQTFGSSKALQKTIKFLRFYNFLLSTARFFVVNDTGTNCLL